MKNYVICTSQNGRKISIVTGFFFKNDVNFSVNVQHMVIFREKNNMFFIAVSKIEQNYLVRVEEKLFIIFLKTSISPSLLKTIPC